MDEHLLLALGGSSKHVVGHEGAANTYSRSSTPALVDALYRGIESGQYEPRPYAEDESAEEDRVYRAIAIAQHYLRPPTQSLEFFAKTLMVGKTHDIEQYVGIEDAKVILGTPLCGKKQPHSKTKLVYFGFDNREETPEDVIRLAKTWGDRPLCSHWRATIKKENADYQMLFGTSDVTIIDRQGQVLYSGGQGVLYSPHGNPDGSGVNICKLKGEQDSPAHDTIISALPWSTCDFLREVGKQFMRTS